MPRSEGKHRIWSYVIAGFLLLALWYVISVLLGSIALPTPSAVFCAFITGLRIDLLSNLIVRAARVGYWIALALSLAVPLGLISYRNKADKIITPFIYLLYPIPHIVLLPLIILLFGIAIYQR